MKSQTHLPPGRWENVLIALIIAPLDDFPCMGLVLFLGGIRKKANVVMYIEVEQRSRFPSGLVDDKVIESVVLWTENDMN